MLFRSAVIAGARYIFAIDPVEWKREQALKFGATHAFANVDEAAGAIAEITHGGMCKKVIVTVGEVKGSDVNGWMNITAKAGTCVLTGMGQMFATDVTLDLSMLTLLQKNLQGSIFGGANPKLDIPLLLSMYKVGKLNIADMITREYTLDQINEGYKDMLEGRNIRGVIRYTDADHPRPATERELRTLVALLESSLVDELPPPAQAQRPQAQRPRIPFRIRRLRKPRDAEAPEPISVA